MSEFFVLTHRIAVGPLSGVELREAALAGIIHHTCVVGGAPEGPWHQGAEVGLFSQKGVPKPHPPSIEIPQFLVKGNRNSVQGPFKLRELIGMAARGMLPAEALLQRVGVDRWAKAESLPILNHCLSGDLVLVSASGEICQQTSGVLEGVNPSHGRTEDFYAPIDRPQTIKVTDFNAGTNSSSAETSEVSRDEADRIQADQPNGDSSDSNRLVRDRKGPGKSSESLPKSSLLTRSTASFRSWIAFVSLVMHSPPKWLIKSVAVSLVVLAVVGGVLWWMRPTPVQQADIIGDWIAVAGNNASTEFGISFDPDGTCVIFNVEGNSWTGDYVWANRSSSHAGALELDGTRVEIDTIGEGHFASAVQSTDGYLTLRGSARMSPTIGEHEIQDLFLRMAGNQLQIGYPISVEWESGQKTLTAGWVELQSSIPVSDADARELVLRTSQGDPEPANSRQRRIYDRLEGASSGQGLVASETIDSAFLLRQVGVPDLARKAFPVEIPDSARSDIFTADQIVRYGGLTFLVNSSGQVEHLQFISP